VLIAALVIALVADVCWKRLDALVLTYPVKTEPTTDPPLRANVTPLELPNGIVLALVELVPAE
jgi:hypothetical protein